MIQTHINQIRNSFLLLFIAFFINVCSTKQEVSQKPAVFPEFSAESHRGGRGIMPENTIPAMLYSLSLDYITTLEMDIHVTSDKQLTLSHDAYLNPLITLKPDGTEIDKSENKDYPIYKMTYNKIKEFDVGLKVNERFPNQKKIKSSIPLLGEVIDSVQHYIKVNDRQQVFYNIETKSSEEKDNVLNASPEEFVKLLMDLVEEKKVVPYVIIQSFDVRVLQILRENYSHVRTSYLVGPARRKQFTIEEDLEVLGFEPYIYSAHFKYITKEEIEECHQKGIKVVVWTPNTQKEVNELITMGVDGIITDYPELLAE